MHLENKIPAPWVMAIGRCPLDVNSRPARLSAISKARGPSMAEESARAPSEGEPFTTNHHLRSPSSSSLPHVSRSPLYLIQKFPVNFQQCLGCLQKAYQKRSPCPSTSRPAPRLQLFQRHSRCHSSASTRIPSVPGSRRKADKMARPDRECLVFVIGNSWRGCQSGMPKRMNLYEIPLS